MQRVDTTTAIGALPSDDAGGTPGFFTKGDPGQGVNATIPGQDWFNSVQEELAAPIEAIGTALNKATKDQLYLAIKKIAGADINAYAFADSPVSLPSSYASYKILVNASAGAVVLGLPPVSGNAGLSYEIEVSDDTNTVTVNPDGVETIEGAAAWPVDSFMPLRLYCDGTEWIRRITIPPGLPTLWPKSTPPAGAHKRNGSAVGRTTYRRLFKAIGTVFGVGDGSTTFNLPEDRGEFERNWDDGRGVDAGRTLNSYQADNYKSHSHGINGGGGSISRLDTNHWIMGSTVNYGDSNTYASGGSETRPRNKAKLAIIFY